MNGRFADRTDAGQQLSRQLLHLKERDPVVLALPRGGVPVAFEVARALGAPLDLLIVRKIGAPDQPELALGAVVNGERSETVLNQDIVNMLRIPKHYIEQATDRELEEIERRRRTYLGDRKPISVKGRSVIVIDDGIATGASMKAALLALRRREPEYLVLAVPVAPAEVIEELRRGVDEVVCLVSPAPFYAIGLYYMDFRQLVDKEVVEILHRATALREEGHSRPPPASTAPES